MAGRYFDEWNVGDVVAQSITRTVTETDNVLVSALTHNPQPMHLDHEVAAGSEFGKPLVNSIYTFGLMIGVSVADTREMCTPSSTCGTKAAITIFLARGTKPMPSPRGSS